LKNKINQFERSGEISKQKADQIRDDFNDYYKDKYFRILKKSLLAPQIQETSIEMICNELNLKPGKNDWDGLHYQSIIDSLAYFTAESHPILVTCDKDFAKMVRGKGYRVINPQKQSQKEIEAVLA
jgi:hypothetical protein